jgi:virulence factor Mce-like protein
MVIFALSCLGLLLYLWTAFGGSIPLQPRGYRFAVSFDEATQLTQQADVRISGVSVGKVIRTEPEAHQGLTRTTIELDSRYVPLHTDARAILRTKTLLGETYVELTPGTPAAPAIPDGGSLPQGRVQPTVELDELLRAFDPRTRRDFRTWLTSYAGALNGRGQDVSNTLGEAPAATENTTNLLTALDTQRDAVTRLIRDSGTVFGAVGRQEGAVRTLIGAGDRVFATTAARDADLRDALVILPTFLRELRPTLAQAEATARVAAPVVHDLRAAAPHVPPVLRNVDALAPDLRVLFRRADTLVDVSRDALPALTRIVRSARPLVDVLYPVARELAPVADYLGIYRQEVVTMFANVAASTQATMAAAGQPAIHYLRVLIPLTTEGFVTQSQRLASNRHNAYLAPGGLAKLASGLEAFDCSNVNNPQTVPVLGSTPACKVQAPPLIQGRRTAYPQLRRSPP